MNILMLSVTFPYPPTQGGTQVRTFNLLQQLRRRHQVTLVTLTAPDVSPDQIETLRSHVDELVVFDRPTFGQNHVLLAKISRLGQFLLSGVPASVRSSYSSELQAWLDRAVDSGKYDVLTCEHSVNEAYVRDRYRTCLKTVVNIHSSVYATCRNQLETGTAEKPGRDRINLPLLKRYEQRYSQKFDHIVVTTQDDADQFRTFAPYTPIHVIPNGVDFEAFPLRSADPGGASLIFIGAMDNLANIDAVRFLSLEIFPPVQARYPGVTLALVGARPVPEVAVLAQQPSITVTGAVDSMAAHLHTATVCVIPMRTGYGIKNKTLEAMAAGVPVVSSDRGLEGLKTDHPVRALRANTVAQYLDAISQVLDSLPLREEMSRQARGYIESEFTWEIAGNRYEQVVSASRAHGPIDHIQASSVRVTQESG